ncbi:MAG: hypothetical protein GF387_01950 [Candidatus Portnoybacteria bacterium]|nr:hypothetical protein [Candidatus Portnoybacteria bacterium]
MNKETKNLKKLEKTGLIDAFDLKPDEVFEARYNLLGFFGVLQKIDQRLKKEKLMKKKDD